MSTHSELAKKFRSVWPLLDERTRRLMAANEAMALGHGGVSLVQRASGLSRKAISKGMQEIRSGEPLAPGRIRRPGAGRKPITESDPGMLGVLEELLDLQTRGDPESPLRWTCLSTRAIAQQLERERHHISHTKVAQILHDLGYSLQSNRKTEEGADHPDRDAQFRHIGSVVKACLAKGLPVISVDTKKKELIGPFKNAGKEWQQKGEPVQVNMHDFADPELGKVIPYGVYDIGRNEGWVSVGISHDTAQFAVEAIRRWWLEMGQRVYPAAPRLLITADGGGSNGARVRLWKLELQRLADELGLELHVRHFPPGTSKWNKIEHRMFCHITKNWRGRPLISRMVVVALIAATRTAQGLVLQAQLDEAQYETGKTVTDDEMRSLAIQRCEFHGEWNYSLSPRPRAEP
jgi:hypothetical protein